MSFVDAPAARVYAISCLALCFNVTLLWALSGWVRHGTKTVMNPEDIGVPTHGSVVEHDPPAVERILRAHRNAVFNIVPFLLVGQVYVALDAPASTATWIFGVFTCARWAHSIAYLFGLQPWRTIIFVIGLITTLVLMALTALQL